MKILVDGRTASGGIARYTRELVRVLGRELGPDQLLVYRAADASEPTERERRLARRTLGLVAGRARRITGDQLGLPLATWLARADVVHCPGVVPALGRAPAVATCYDLFLLDRFDDYKQGPMKYYERRALLAALAGAAHVVTLSETVAEALRRRFGLGPERLTTIAPPLADFPPAGGGRLPADLEPRRFLISVGVLEPRKNLRALLEAHEAVWSERRVPLVLIGPYGWSRRDVVRAAAQSGGRVRWIGAVDDATLGDAYRSAAAAVQYSLDEGFGYPAAEALGLGTPLVLSDIAAHRELAGDCALFAPPHDIRALADRLHEVLRWTDSDRAMHAARAARRTALLRARGESRLYLDLYRRLCEQGPPPALRGKTPMAARC